MKQSDTSANLIESLKHGDHDAFDRIYMGYYEPIRRFLSLLTKSEADAEDLAQQVFITLWEKRERIDSARNFKAYLYSIARNYTLNLFDRQKVEEKYLRYNGFYSELSDAPDEELVGKELRLLVELQLQKMPAKRRQVYLMRREEGLSIPEIAEKLGLSRNTVKNHMQNAENDIREIIALFFILFIIQ